MLADVLARINHRLEVVGLTATTASKKAGLSEDAIRNLRRAVDSDSRKGVSTKTLTALAPVLLTTPGWLIEGEGPEEAEIHPTVPIVGYVKAGAEAVLYSEGQGPFGRVPAPEGSTASTVAAEIRGDSLGELFSEWLIYYDDVRSPVTPDLFNRLCVVGLPDGRILVKKIRPSKTPGFYHLDSNTEGTLTDQEVVWAARVKQMTPR